MIYSASLNLGIWRYINSHGELWLTMLINAECNLFAGKNSKLCFSLGCCMLGRKLNAARDLTRLGWALLSKVAIWAILQSYIILSVAHMHWGLSWPLELNFVFITNKFFNKALLSDAQPSRVTHSAAAYFFAKRETTCLELAMRIPIASRAAYFLPAERGTKFWAAMDQHG